MFRGIVRECSWTRSSLAALLRQCRDLDEGKQIHTRIASSSSEDTFLGNLLVQMYSRCGSLDDARLAFQEIAAKNAFSWTIIISALSKSGRNQESLGLFKLMLQEGIKPTEVTMVALFGACSNLGSPALSYGKTVEDIVVNSGGVQRNLFMENTLISMYGRCGSLERATMVFESMEYRDVFSWTAIISAYAQNGHLAKAVEMFYRMDARDVKPTEVTLATVLGACCKPEMLEDGRSIHSRIVSSGLQDNSSIGTALVIMYMKCGSLREAKAAFDSLQHRDVVCWNAIMAAHSQAGDAVQVLELLTRMHLDGVRPNEITFSTALSACCSIEDLHQGEKIHQQLAGTVFEFDEVLGNTLISFYGKCGDLTSAWDVFNKLGSNRSIVSWNAMVAVCGQHQEFNDVLKLFKQLDMEGIKPDEITFVGVLDACSNLGELQLGRTVHLRAAAEGLEQNPILGTALVDLYGKAGKLNEARTSFDKLKARDLVTWNSLLTAHSKLGQGRECLEMLQQMSNDGVQPSEVTFVNCLAACSHSGTVHQAWECFHAMEADYGIKPLLEHYGCMVDLLGRSGRVEEMELVMKNMKAKPDLATWTSVLSACSLHFDVDKGMQAANQVVKLEQQQQQLNEPFSGTELEEAGQEDVGCTMSRLQTGREVGCIGTELGIKVSRTGT